MKRLLFLLLYILPVLVSAQVHFSDAKSIASVGGNTIRSADIDGDGDFDLLLFSNQNIVWYPNQDGKGSWGSPKLISSSMSPPESIFTADIDGDSDLDVLFATPSTNIIAWYENIDGKGNFGSQKLISDQVGYADGVHAADLDGDGDLDALSASAWDDKIAWYENTDGKGTFGDQNIISTLEEQPSEVYAADIDLDGDMDVISAVRHINNIVLYENTDGHGVFQRKQIISQNQNQTNQLHIIDMNGDGYPDILAASRFEDVIAWYKNDANGRFGAQRIIKNPSPNWDEADDVTGAWAVDLDMDGDLDILAASEKREKIFWFERINGTDNFGPEQTIILTGETQKNCQIVPVDVDGDGDADILSSNIHRIEWFENLTNPTSVQANQSKLPVTFLLYQNYPNPFSTPPQQFATVCRKKVMFHLKSTTFSGRELKH